MTGLLVAVGVPVAAFTALVVGVWHHRGRHTGRHAAPTGTPDRSVTIPAMHATMPIAHTRHRAPWDETPEPDETWVGELRAALDEVQPSGWVKPELHHILAAPILAGELDLAAAVDVSPQTAELAREPSGWVKPELGALVAGYLENCVICGRITAGQPLELDLPRWICPGDCTDAWRAAEARNAAGEWLTTEPVVWLPEPSRLADTADHGSAALALDVADYMAAQDADATRYGGDLVDWCAYQLRALRETLRVAP